MRKLFTLFFVLLSIAFTTSLMAQNLIAGWSGNGVTGDLSKPNLVGWTNTSYASIPWSTANSSGGCRFRDAGTGYTAGTFTNEADGSVNDGRQLMLRYDGGAYSASIYGFPVELEANKSYTFTVDFLIGGSDSAPKNLPLVQVSILLIWNFFLHKFLQPLTVSLFTVRLNSCLKLAQLPELTILLLKVNVHGMVLQI